MPVILGIVGKPSSGKSTFLNAACLTDAKVSELPFTTIEPNKGIAYVRTKCLCKDMNLEDNPQNSLCIDGNRFIPINLLDVAGLVPDAHKGKGLGNQFLNDLSRCDLLIHIVDSTGSLDKAGHRTTEGANDPLEDMKFLEEEINFWFKDIIKREDWSKFVRSFARDKKKLILALAERLSGLKINPNQIRKALKDSDLEKKIPNDWTEEDLLKFATILREISKPILTVFNKIDKESGQINFERLESIIERKVIPCSALAEYTLRKYHEDNLIKYLPGSDSFKFLKAEKLSKKEKDVLSKIQSRILQKFKGTGVQTVFNYSIFSLLGLICVYPVSDINNLTDNKGNILPDIFLVKKGTKLREFVKNKIHSEIADSFLYGIHAISKRRLGEDYELQNNDIVKIVSTK